MLKGFRHIGLGKCCRHVLAVLACMLLSHISMPVSYAQSAAAALKMNPKAYTGKSAWWYNYQYFPELTIFGQSDDTIPDVKHRYSFYINGGYAGFEFSHTPASAQKSLGLGFGGRYNYFVSPNWGFRTGLGLDYAKTTAKMGEFVDDFLKTDQESDQVHYHYSFSSVEEDYDIYMLSVPLQLVYQYKRLMGGFGIKPAFPISVAYSQTITDINTKAYFPQYDVWVDDSWVMACGDYPYVPTSNKYMASPIVILATADLEYMIPVNRKFSIGVSAFIDYSINSSFSFRKSQLSSVYTDQNSMVGTTNEVPISLVNNSLLSGKKNYESESVVQHIHYMNAGLRVSLNVNSYGPPKPRTKPY